jgi:uncharacterized repeat protein (TIGR01451 family)
MKASPPNAKGPARLAGWFLATLLLAGCTHTQPHSEAEPAPTPGTPPTAQPAPVSGSNPTSVKSGGETSNGLVRLAKTMPPEVSLGSEFLSEWSLTAQASAANIVVRDTVPAGATYVRSEPAATVAGNQLTWNLGNLDAGQVSTAKVWLQANQEGQLSSWATVTADARAGAQTVVGKPILTLQKTGPESAVLGTEVTYQLVVKNTGTGTARNVMVTNPVPAGFSHSTGKTEVSLAVGDLAPGQSKPLAVTFKATQRGKICSTGTASSSNADKVSSEVCTVILVPGLKIEQSGTKEQILGRNADYEIIVTNPGDTTLHNVIVTDTAPADTAIIAAPGARIEGQKATWTIAELKPGAKTTQTVKLTSRLAGTHCNTVTASVGNLTDSAKACTLWKGIPAVALEVGDDPDPIQIGESTTYTIRVTNQGFADINNIKVVASFDAEVAPVSSPEGTVAGRNVTFPIVAKLPAKQVLTYTITVKGAKVGDSRNKITLTADQLKTPVEQSESTTVY